MSPISPSNVTGTSNTHYERHARRNGHLGHPTRWETSTRALELVPTTFPPSPPSSSLADTSHSLSRALFPYHGPTVDTVSSHAPLLTPQDSTLASSLLAPASSRSTSAGESPAGSGYDFVSNSRYVDPAIQIRPTLPQVKVCLLCTGGSDLPVLPDAGLVMQGLARVRNIDPEHMITRTGKNIDVALDKFFDPIDVRKGGLLILIISCHGRRGNGGVVSLPFQTQDGKVVDSAMLQEKIMALPKHCTFEAVVDTCFAEGVIPGLRRIMPTEPLVSFTAPSGMLDSARIYTPPLGSHPKASASVSPASLDADPGALFSVRGSVKPSSLPFKQGDQPEYKARVVVWAASTKWGVSYPEADLPEKPGMYSTLIGAIFGHPSSRGTKTSRQSIWENVREAVEQQNHARNERDLRKPPAERTSIIRENRIQRPILLASLENPNYVLNGPVFRPIKKRSRHG